MLARMPHHYAGVVALLAGALALDGSAIAAARASGVVGAGPAQPAGVSASARDRVDALVRESGAKVAIAFRTRDGRLEMLVEPDLMFHAASTMKVAVMIELFRQQELGLVKLDDPMPVVNRFTSVIDGSQFTLAAQDDLEPELYKRVGQLATARELCELMITVSSNLATNVLMQRLGTQKIQQTIVDLGAGGMQVIRPLFDPKAIEAGRNNTTTARALFTLMEALAQGRAVTPAASREMIEILKRQRWNDAIPAGLPPGTPVAHKHGNVTRIYHDAALVFGPRPYTLVVLVGGIEDEKVSTRLIADIARTLHQAATPPQ